MSKKVSVEIAKNIDVNYNPKYVTKIKKSLQEYKDGDYVTIEKADFKKFLGLE